jgi:hypothetical protein
MSHTLLTGEIIGRKPASEITKVILVYGVLTHPQGCGVCAAIYSCHNHVELATLMNAISVDRSYSKLITRVIFLNKSDILWGELDEAINIGWIDLFDQDMGFCVPHKLI